VTLVSDRPHPKTLCRCLCVGRFGYQDSRTTEGGLLNTLKDLFEAQRLTEKRSRQVGERVRTP
jgi:hypothetical protein